MNTHSCTGRKQNNLGRGLLSALLAVVALFLPLSSHAEDTVCARVKIEILQELTLERQGFDAMMRITNGLDTTTLDNVAISINFTDEAGNSVRATENQNDLTASFFIREDTLTGINNVKGTGTVASASVAEVHWLIVPNPGSGGTVPTGKLYYVGATLNYSVGGKAEQVVVTPDFIYVKPMPLLTLDYFLTQDVFGDDPLTPPIEPIEPYALGVRIKNTGAATARNVKIESAQPRIVDNQRGLLINFQIVGSYLNDLPSTPSLLIPFGDIPANGATNGRWIMTSSLAGHFVSFTATSSHADELGGAVTSLMGEPVAHFLIRDVKVDLPGRDNIRDFLADDGVGGNSVFRLYESSGLDTAVVDQSTSSLLTATGTGAAGVAMYALSAPATAGVMFVRLPDPYGGAKALGKVTRSDGKVIAADNVWLSKKREAGVLKYYFNLFDTNTTGQYNVAITDPAAIPRAPVIQFIADKSVAEGQQVSFIMSASDPDGTAPTVTTSPLPNGATFTSSIGANNLVNGIFDWTPGTGQFGKYPITFTASDGALTTSATAVITVTSPIAPAGPDVPVISAPPIGTQVSVVNPELAVLLSTNPLDTATSYHFQLYADAGFQTLVAERQNVVATALGARWPLVTILADNSTYYWRVRAFDDTTYSEWAMGHFFINTANDPPRVPGLATPASGTTVALTTPTLSITNSVDPEGETVVYGVEIFANSSLTQKVTGISNVAAGSNGATSWTVTPALNDTTLYYWRATASDTHGAKTISAVGSFLVDTTKPAPGAPALIGPTTSSTVTTTSVDLNVANSLRPTGMVVSYYFEVDRAASFTSADIIRSGAQPESASSTRFALSGLIENAQYYWRVKVSDGLTDSPWTTGNFFVDTVNDPPSIPGALNPGNAAWITTLRPLFVVAPSVDPEGDAIAYHIQVYSDVTLTTLVAERLTNTLSWWIDVPLTDNTPYYWRVRAEDLRGGASPWSPVSTFLVRTGSSTPMTPTLTLTTPVDIVSVSGASVTLTWEIEDPEHNSKLALYVDTDNQNADGARIIDGLPQDPASRTGSYRWDVSTLAPGSYYIYGIATNSAGSHTRYAPGVFVVPPPSPRGIVSVTALSPLETTEAGGSARFSVVLGNSPKSDVSVGLSVTHPQEAQLDKAQLLFNTANWTTPQTVTLTGLPDCINDGDISYQMITASSQSADPDYHGIKGIDLNVVNRNSSVGCPSNNPPQANAGPNQVVAEGTNVVLIGSGADSDGAIASYRWVQTAGPTVALTSTTHAISGFTAPSPTTDTVFTFQLTVTDNQGATGIASVSVTVKAAANLPPTANTGANQSVQSGSTVTLNGTGTDPDGTIAAYAWTQIAGPSVTLTGAATARASFIAPPVAATTVLGFQLTVTDNLGATGLSTVIISVIPNQLPVVSAGVAQTVNEKLPVSLTGIASDPDGTIASYLWAQTAGPSVTLTGATTASASFTAPSVTVDTVLSFTLTVNDNLGASTSASVTITVKNVPSLPPVAHAGGPYVGKMAQVVTFDGTGSKDPEGAALIYKWAFGDGSTGTGVSPTHAYAVAGIYTVSLIVNDGEQDSIPVTIGAVIVPAVAGNVAAGILPGNPVIPPNKPQAMVILASNQTGVTLPSVTVEYSYSVGLLITNLIAPGASTASVDTLNRKVKLSWSNVPTGQNLGAAFAAASLIAGTYTLTPSKVQYVLPNGTIQTLTANSATLKVSSTGNKVPSVSTGPAQTLKQGTLTSLQGSAIDTDGTIIAYYWKQLTGPAVVLSTAFSRAPTFTAPTVSANTTLGFVLFAIDNNGGLGLATTSVTVTP